MRQKEFLAELAALLPLVKGNEGWKRQKLHAKRFTKLLEKYGVRNNRRMRVLMQHVQDAEPGTYSPQLKQFAGSWLKEMKEKMNYKKFINLCSYTVDEKRILLFAGYRYLFPEQINASIRPVQIPVKGIEGRAMKSKRRQKENPLEYTHNLTVRMGLVARELHFKGGRLRAEVGASHHDPECGVTLYERGAPGRGIMGEYGPFRSYSFKYMGHIRSAYQAKQWLKNKRDTRRKRVDKLEESYGRDWSLIKAFCEKVVGREVLPFDAQNQERTNKVMTIAFKTLKKKAYERFESLITSEERTDQILAKDLASRFVLEVEMKTKKWRAV